MGITLFTTRELLSALGIEDYGVFNVVCGFVSMFSFLNTSLANGTQRFYNYELAKNGDQGVSKVYTHSFYIQIISALLLILLIEIIGVWYIQNMMVIPIGRLTAAHWIFQFSIFNLFFVMITVPYSAAVMAYERMDFYAIVSIVEATLKLCFVILLPYINFDNLIFYGFALFMINVLNFILYIVYCKKQFSSIIFQHTFNKDLTKSLLTFSSWNIFGSVAFMGQTQGVNMILNYFWGTIVNAANGVATQVNHAVSSLTAGFVTALRPQMIQSYAKGDYIYMMKLFNSSSKITFYLTMVLSIPMMLEISTILDLWLGVGKYPEITTLFCQLTILIPLFGSYAIPTSIIVHATGKMKRFQLITSMVTLSVIPMSILIACLGGQAYMIIICSVIITIAAQFSRIIIVRKLVPLNVDFYAKDVILRTISVFGVSLLFSYIVHQLIVSSILTSFISLITSLAISVCVVFLIGLNKEEKRMIRTFVKR